MKLRQELLFNSKMILLSFIAFFIGSLFMIQISD